MNRKNTRRHIRFMRLAIDEAKKGLGNVEPNPAVGCVIVRDNRVIAKAHHKFFGGPHAEAAALGKARDDARGATLYVSLEPCCHFGKTPPCTDAIIEAGIKEVVCAMADPNPINYGRGFKILRRKGIKVITGILRKDAERLNKPFIDRIKRQRPLITLKMAQSLDGKIATRRGDSRWISSEPARQIVQKLRSSHDAVMVGANTVIRDNPHLGLRNRRNKGRQPIRIIVDGGLKIPLNAKVLAGKTGPRVIIATTKQAPKSKEQTLARKGAQVLRIRSNAGRVDLKSLSRALAKKGVASILVEGGGELAASLLENGIVDRIIFFVAPMIIGGRDAITSVEGVGAKRLKDAIRLKNIRIRQVGCDFMIEAEPV